MFQRAPGVGEGTRTWKFIHSVEANKRHILIYLIPHQAYVVPRSAFAYDVEAAAFLDRAKSFHEAARQNPASA